MSDTVRFSNLLSLLDLNEDPIPVVDRNGNVVPVVGSGGQLAGLETVEDRLVDERSITSIAKEIEKLFKWHFKWEGDIPIASESSKTEVKWSWGLAWSFYEQRYKRLVQYCNRKFQTDRNVTPMTLWLTHLYFSAKYHGRCHLLGVTLKIDPKHPARVSFGKRRHDRSMTTGWSSPRPQTLSQFSEELCNLIPESWSANLLRGNWSRDHVEAFFQNLIQAGIDDEYGGSLLMVMNGLRMDDGIPTSDDSFSVNNTTMNTEELKSSMAIHLRNIEDEFHELVQPARIRPRKGEIHGCLAAKVQMPIGTWENYRNLKAFLSIMLGANEQKRLAQMGPEDQMLDSNLSAPPAPSRWFHVNPQQAQACFKSVARDKFELTPVLAYLQMINEYMVSSRLWTQPRPFNRRYHLLDQCDGSEGYAAQLFNTTLELKPQEWLQDLTMTFYGALITETFAPSVLYLGPHFNTYYHIVELERRIEPLQHLEKSPLLFPVWIFPMNLRNVHWCAVGLYPLEKSIVIYDSVGQSTMELRRNAMMVLSFLALVHEHYEGQAVDLSAWTINGIEAMYEFAKGFPTQDGADWSWGTADMKDIRRVMIEELAQQKLRERD
ncbi:uncharacterized protein IL334_002784 [Kwoniella shivajii]|uniref:Ubiquitin-like protease family profile domain-containing protein n=1 Tax=Kwoniella shivajii TaxID=564305 RepID=A0ABZ1CWB3_9TREE|nr:hypothetical protein IL334_002784 [Kwoniella shivajii]